MEAAAIVTLSCLAVGVFGFGVSAKDACKAYTKAKWSDPAQVIPLTKRPCSWHICSDEINKRCLVKVKDFNNILRYTFERSGNHSNVWYLVRQADNCRTAIIRCSSTGSHVKFLPDPQERVFEAIKLPIKSCEGGKYRQFTMQEYGGVCELYRWSARSFFLEHITNIGQGHNEVHHRIAYCHKMGSKDLDYQIDIDECKIDKVVALTTAFICMLSLWKDLKWAKSKTLIELERQAALESIKLKFSKYKTKPMKVNTTVNNEINCLPSCDESFEPDCSSSTASSSSCDEQTESCNSSSSCYETCSSSSAVSSSADDSKCRPVLQATKKLPHCMSTHVSRAKTKCVPEALPCMPTHASRVKPICVPETIPCKPRKNFVSVRCRTNAPDCKPCDSFPKARRRVSTVPCNPYKTSTAQAQYGNDTHVFKHCRVPPQLHDSPTVVQLKSDKCRPKLCKLIGARKSSCKPNYMSDTLCMTPCDPCEPESCETYGPCEPFDPSDSCEPESCSAGMSSSCENSFQSCVEGGDNCDKSRKDTCCKDSCVQRLLGRVGRCLDNCEDAAEIKQPKCNNPLSNMLDNYMCEDNSCDDCQPEDGGCWNGTTRSLPPRIRKCHFSKPLSPIAEERCYSSA